MEMTQVETGQGVAHLKKQRKIQKYDFRRTRRLSKVQREGLQTVTQSFSKLVYTYFSTLFRFPIEVNLDSIDEIEYSQYVESRPVPDCIWTFKTGLSGDLGILNMDSDMIFIIVDRLFGGNGRSRVTARPTTQIEKNIMRRVVDRIFQMWDQSWQNFVEIESKQKSYETKPFLVQMVSPNDPVINIIFNIKIMDDDFRLNFCIPLAVLEPLVNYIVEQSSNKKDLKKVDARDVQMIKSTLLKAEIPFIVCLGKMKISLKDFMNLEEGDVVRIDQDIRKPLFALVHDKPKFMVTPGLSNNRRAVKVIDECHEEEYNVGE